MKPIFKQVTIWASTLVVSAGVAFAAFFDYSALNKNPANNGNNGGNNQNGNVEKPSLSPQQALLNSLVSIDDAKINGGIEVTTVDNKTVDVKVDGNLSIDTTNLDNIRFEGGADVELNGTKLHGDLNYYQGKIFFDFEQAKLFLETQSLLDFVEMIPNYGVDIALPEEITNIDLNGIIEKVNSMEPEKAPNGYFFTLPLSEEINLYLKSDENYNFTGVRTDKFYFQDTYIYLDFDVDQNFEGELEFTTPNILEYQDFAPTFDLINVIYNTFSKDNNTLNLNVDINHLDNPYLTFDADLSYDKALSSLSLDGAVIETSRERTHEFKLGYQNSNLIVDYNNLKFKIQGQSINTLINYVLTKVGDVLLSNSFGDLSGVMQGVDINEIINNLTTANNFIKKIDVTSESVKVTLNIDSFGLEVGDIILDIGFDKTTFKGISINDLMINGYTVDINLSTKEYSPVNFVESEYTAIDPALCLIDAFEGLSQESKFRVDFKANVDDSVAETQDISINGGLQFDLDGQFGYGNLNLVDKANYAHNIKVDMRSYDEILFAYNETMKGRFSSNFFTDVFDMVSEILNNKDDHFYELFGDLLNNMSSLPLMDAINNSDYGKLFEIGLIDSLKVSENAIELGIYGGLLGLDNVINIEINYDRGADDRVSILKGIKVKDFKVGENTFNFEASLSRFDDSLENTRLDPQDVYIEFDSLAVLLRLGINTSVYNHYHFSGSANINIDFGLFGDDNKDIPIDVKVLNEKGNVSVAVELTNIPIISVLNGGESGQWNNENRRASLYYKDGYFYINRKEEYREGWFWGDWKTYETYAKVESSYFLDNIIYYLCDMVLGFNDTILDLIGNGSSSDSESSGSTIKYENLISRYSYNENSENPFFKFDLNLFELTKMDMFDTLNLKVYVNDETKTLSGLDIGLDIKVLLTIGLGAKLDLVDLGSEFTLDTMNSYIEQHQNDVINQTYTIN